MKTKPKYQFVILCLFVILCYQLAIKKTIALNNEINNLITKSDSVNIAKSGIQALENKRNELETLLGVNYADSNNVQQMILNLVNEQCVKNGISISSVPQIKYTTLEDYKIETNIIVLQGNFVSLLKATNFLEQHTEIGNIISAKYQSERDLRTNKLSLKLTLYIQNFKKQIA